MNITKRLSPNKYQGRSGWKPDCIVCHITEGAYAGAVSWLSNPVSEASAHFVVAKDGRITQLVELTDGSWCNGTSSDPASRMYFGKSTLSAVRDRKTNANYYTISIEHEGIWVDAHGKLADAQLAATIELIRYIRAEVKRIYSVDIPLDREHIVGHYQISPINKPNCPGSAFQFDEIIKQLRIPEVVMSDYEVERTRDWARLKKVGILSSAIPDKTAVPKDELAVILCRFADALAKGVKI